ncbi:MAG: flippase-like domain-containing protein [Deltaproteobacteria bacterium]|nr:flippase-like domain-containing protein [Deltaproteobacteria bacterium]
MDDQQQPEPGTPPDGALRTDEAEGSKDAGAAPAGTPQTPPTPAPDAAPPPPPGGRSLKKTVGFAVKLLISLGILAYVIWKIGRQAEWDQLQDRLADLDWSWVALGFLAQLCAMACTLTRWKLLLDGQEMHVPLKHLIGTFMIGRFIGTFTPSTVGLDGYRMFDIAKHSRKIAPAVSVILVEKVIGFFVLSMLVLLTLPWGLAVLPSSTLTAVGALYSVPVLLSLVLLSKPSLIQRLLGVFFRPGTALGKKVETAAAAVTTYEAQRGKLVRAVAIGFPVHLFSICIFICTGYAIGAPISLTDMLFVGPLVITATVLPISLSGLGVREAAFIYLLTATGVSVGEAALLSFLGYLIGRVISMFGGIFWIVRRVGYKVEITGKAMERRDEAPGPVAEAPAGPTRPDRPLLGPGRHLWLGAAAGLAAGMLVGLAEMTYVLLRIPPPRPWGALLYASSLYGAVCAALGLGLGLSWWLLGRFAGGRRGGFRASVEGLWTGTAFALVAGLGLVIARFRVFRDLFDEKLPAMGAGGLGVQFALLLVFGALFVGGFVGVRRLLRRPAAAWFRRAWGPLVPVLALLVPGLLGLALEAPRSADAAPGTAPPPNAPNVVFVMVDTLRVDELGAYNPEAAARDQTPAMDALAREGIVFSQAFAQASWTRPSVASAMTGRFPSTHGATHKDDALPDAAQTLAELLRAKGYRTAGIVTNYNLAPDFNFQQGFDDYVYLTPRYFLGADDTTAKLALYQIFRLVHERYASSGHDVDRYYQDARRATDEALGWLDHNPDRSRPFFLWVQYMDPHDPYFAHDGSGDVFGHALNPSPPASRRDRIVEVYRQEVRYTDDHLGRLFDGLRARGLLDRSVVFVWADHGEEFLDHGDWWHGTTLYDELVHVPLIVRLPRTTPRAGWKPAGLSAGKRFPGWVSLIDMPWTILHEVGYTPEQLAAAGYQGADLFTPRAQPSVFMEEDHQGNVLRGLRWCGSDGSAYKLIQAEALNRPGLRPEELYGVAPSDRPGPLTAAGIAAREQQELSVGVPTVVAEGRRAIARPAEAARRAALPRQQVTSATDDERLKALGYIQDQNHAPGGQPPDPAP